MINDLKSRVWNSLHLRRLLSILCAFGVGWTLQRLTTLSKISTLMDQPAKIPAVQTVGDEEPAKLNGAGVEGHSLTERTKRLRTEVRTFLLVAVAFGALGWWLLPNITQPHVVPGFRISAEWSKATAISVDAINYSEAHPRNNAIDAQVIVVPDKAAVPADSQLEINLQLPDNVTYQSCEDDDPNSHPQCFSTSTGGAYADISFLRQTTTTGVIFHLSGPGLGFVESGGQVAAQLPLVSSDAASGGTGFVEYKIKDVSGYQWSGEQPALTVSEATWTEPLATMLTNQIIATGVRGDIQSKNSDLTFAAGVIIGIAGAALIAALQAVFKRLSQE